MRRTRPKLPAKCNGGHRLSNPSASDPVVGANKGKFEKVSEGDVRKGFEQTRPDRR